MKTPKLPLPGDIHRTEVPGECSICKQYLVPHYFNRYGTNDSTTKHSVIYTCKNCDQVY